MAIKNKSALTSQKSVIKNQTQKKAITPLMMGQMLEDCIDSFLSVLDNLGSNLDSESETVALTLKGAKSLKDQIEQISSNLSSLTTTVNSIDAIIGNTSDGDSIVNKVTELLSVFQNYSEGEDVALKFNNLSTSLQSIQNSLINYVTTTALNTGLDLKVDKAGATLMDLDAALSFRSQIEVEYEWGTDIVEKRIKVAGDYIEFTSNENVIRFKIPTIASTGINATIELPTFPSFLGDPEITLGIKPKVEVLTSSGGNALFEVAGAKRIGVIELTEDTNLNISVGSGDAFNELVYLVIKQDSTGGRACNIDAVFPDDVDPTVNQVPNSLTTFLFYCDQDGNLNYMAGGRKDTVFRALTDSSTINWDTTTNGYNATVVLGGNRTINPPSNIKEGRIYCLEVVQSAAGNNSVFWNVGFVFPEAFDSRINLGANVPTRFYFISRNGTLVLFAGGREQIGKKITTLDSAPATILWDGGKARNAKVNLTANRSLGKMTNGTDGLLYVLTIANAASYTFAWHADYVFPAGFDNSINNSGVTSFLFQYELNGGGGFEKIRYLAGGKPQIPSLTGYAPLASPAFTGSPTVPTPDLADDSTKVANTEFVKNVYDSTSVNLHEDDFTGAGTPEDPIRVVPKPVFNFGDGIDGNVTISVDTVNNAPRFYDDFTVSAPFVFTPSGYKIFAKGRITVASGASISGNGGNGGNGGNTGTAGAAPSNNPAAELGSGGSGQAGGAGTTGASAAGGTTTANTLCMGGTGGSSNAGGAISAAGRNLRFVTEHLISGIALVNGGSGGRAGSSGAGDGTVAGGGGGGSGTAGRVLALFCDELDNQGIISANGGTGGNGGSPTSGNASGGHGGGGGGGGWVYIITNKVINLGTIQANGGAGGAGGTGFGSGANGQNGGAGGAGKWMVYEISTNKWYTNDNPTGA